VTCAVPECHETGFPTPVNINTYADHTKSTRVRLVVPIVLCSRHRYIHGYAWTPRAMPMDGAFPGDYAEFHRER
jgi:hypothetical protein